jgi:hypothetical protein
MVEYYVLMYENRKMRLVETIPGMRGGGIKENDGWMNSTMIYCMNFCKCHNVPQYILYEKKNSNKGLNPSLKKSLQKLK